MAEDRNKEYVQSEESLNRKPQTLSMGLHQGMGQTGTDDEQPACEAGQVGTVKVLIVDDNEVLTGLLKEILEMDEKIYSVMTAENGEDGYTAFLCFKPDIILTDIEMPIKNGLEMVREIRKHDPGIKTIYMSADPNRYRSFLEEEKKRYHTDLLDKPFTSTKMLCLLHEYREERSLQ